MDERLDNEVTAPGVAEPAVQLPLELELMDARCGRQVSLAEVLGEDSSPVLLVLLRHLA